MPVRAGDCLPSHTGALVSAAGGKRGASRRRNATDPAPLTCVPCCCPTSLCSYEKGLVDTRELADLLQQVACFAPGQSFHRAADPSSSAGGSGSWASSSLAQPNLAAGFDPTRSSSLAQPPSAAAGIDPARLQSALAHSLFCVAAYTDESHLPPHQHLGARRLLPPEAQAEYDALQAAAAAGRPLPAAAAKRGRWGWPARRSRRVLVGFARAVGDAALVATVHDVAVLPELQGLGLGRSLLVR